MFDALRSADSGVAIDVVYAVGLRVWERDRFPTWQTWLAARVANGLTAEAHRIATRILEDIEARTGKPLAELSDEEVRPYLRTMYDVLEARRKAERRLDPAATKRILDEMRRDYGSPTRPAYA
jgi:hypothetical protein